MLNKKKIDALLHGLMVLLAFVCVCVLQYVQ